MRSLPEMQSDFLARTLDGRDRVSISWLATLGLAAADGLEIYRNNALVGFQKALQASYPVLVKLAGEDWFNAIAMLYQTRHPSLSGDLNDVGGQFAEFLAAHLEAESHRYGKTYDYFPDIARLEWAFQQVLNLADVEVPDVRDLQQRLAGVDDTFAFILNPSMHLLKSDFPIYEIWCWNRDQTDAVPELSGRGSCVLVLKTADRTQVHGLAPETGRLLEALRSERPFAEVVEPLQIDLPAALAELINAHALVGVRNLSGDNHVN